MKRFFIWLTLLAILGVGATYAWLHAGEREVRTAAVGIGPAVEFVYATGYVEPRRPVSVLATLHRLAHEQGRAVVCVTHDGSMAADADSCIRMLDGRVTA